jgi:hypothetical protein
LFLKQLLLFLDYIKYLVTQTNASNNLIFLTNCLQNIDEILVNAADVKARESHEHRTSSQTMTYIKVNIDTENSVISVCY